MAENYLMLQLKTRLQVCNAVLFQANGFLHINQSYSNHTKVHL